MNYTNEQLAKAKAAQSAEEILELAKAEGVEMTEEDAKKAFLMTREATGELSDDELENVAGGANGCHYKDGRLVVTVLYICDKWKCKNCGNTKTKLVTDGDFSYDSCSKCGTSACCDHCSYCSYEHALWLCNNPENNK